MFSVPMIMWHIYGYAVPVVILAVMFGLRWKVGMWGNCLSLGAVLFSFLIAIGWWEDLAYFLSKQMPAMLFLADGIAFWLIFVISLLFLDGLTRFVSTVKIQYVGMVESIGNGIVLFLLFGVIYGTYLFAEELGPIGARSAVTIGKDNLATPMLRILSAGNLSGFTKVNQFDARGNFRQLHLQRRKAIMANVLSKEGTFASLQASPGNFSNMKRVGK